ncbi:MAG TPA: biotin-dependent carboxyltransferase family protein [Gaiellaceae bacterium]|nr:biotin-dependent carboxyltransferase family protein [Gaiellaceae bacterium]
MTVEVLSAGALTTFQDRGRPGLAHVGVSPSGAVDREAYELGNRLVGNEPGAVALEATLVGPRLRFREPALVALVGADAVTVELDAGEVLDVGPFQRGARVYVCVRGGFRAPAVLGSCSTDILTGIGPPPLRDGDVLELADAASGEPFRGDPPPRELGGELRLLLGPRADWFTPAALETLGSTAWTVTPAANRVGIRLDGPELERARTDELLSEGVVTGALQVPPSGRPILLLDDHPTTGGYPVIGVVRSEDCSRAAQLRPGDEVRFRVAPDA